MSISGLLPLLQEHSDFQRLITTLQTRSSLSEIGHITPAARPFVIAAVAEQLHLPVVIVTQNENTAEAMTETLQTFLEKDFVCFYPDRDALPYERLLTDSQTEQLRILPRQRLLQQEHIAVVCSARALTQPVLPPEVFQMNMLHLSTGKKYEMHILLQQLYGLGYTSAGEVTETGEVAHRGGIIDVFPPALVRPIRIEFFGDTIESLRTFDPETQRSLNPVEQCTITVAREAFIRQGNDAAEQLLQLNTSTLRNEEKSRWQRDITTLQAGQLFDDLLLYMPYMHESASLLEYLPRSGLIILDSPHTLETQWAELDAQVNELHDRFVQEGLIPPGMRPNYISGTELNKVLTERCRLGLEDIFQENAQTDLHFPTCINASSFAGRIPDFLKECRIALERRERIVIVTAQSRRVSEILRDDVQDSTLQFASPAPDLDHTPQAGTLSLIHGSMGEGWYTPELHVRVYTDREIFGWSRKRTIQPRKPVTSETFLSEVTQGDCIVHQDHGIGRFEGLVKLNSDGIEKEYLLLQYAGTDKLYLPTDQLDRVTRYVGLGNSTPALNKLGSSEWTRAKEKVRENVQVVAKDLLQLYAVRESTEGFAFSPDEAQPWLQELEAAFPYQETLDQARTIAEVKTDMEQPKPMDRLICGDVGYGKTEVALRAAFKAVLDHKQVAILVPTTILALQHFETFSERFRAYPVKVELLSRFRTHSEQRTILTGLAEGHVDIVIGTHRILQKDVVFLDLGLLIIDEEQRFGVIHKERLKQLRSEIDVLTLTATPIPRTLHMSLVNARDMSVIETPPQQRLPIRTAIREYDDAFLREVILREIDRGGQVFFVHNRVQGIQVIAAKLQKILPEARIAIGHGQMHEEKLEQVMLDFTHGEYDILLATTIIENGLDIPNANTIIVNNAAKFGLAQLYQLRGRVGRGTHQAYAYFLYNHGEQLSEIQEKRLRAIFEATELGAGFKIAMKDMEIRGAGNLLGEEQSGFMTLIGFDLYSKLLAEAVGELRHENGHNPAIPLASIELPIAAFIPDDYINDRAVKVHFYQRFARITDEEKLDMLNRELRDRFGEPPEQVQNLSRIVTLKLLATTKGISNVAVKEKALILTLRNNRVANRLYFYKNFQNHAQIQHGTIRIPHSLLGGAQWLGKVQEIVTQAVA